MASGGKKVCAVTGAGGFVGGAIKRFLQNAGWRVVDWSRSPAQGVTFRLGSPVDPQLFQGTDALVHCAYDFEPRNRNEIWEINVRGSQRLLDAARLAGLERVVFISSLSAFAGCRSLYGQAKLSIEELTRAGGARVIRPGLVYGEPAGGMFGRLASQVRDSRLIPIVTGGRQTQYLVHADDLGGLVQACLEGKTDSQEPISIAHEQPWQLKDILREIARVLGKRITLVPVPWQGVWAGLKLLEGVGLRPAFRSDSLIGMVYQNPAPSFDLLRRLGFSCRPFALTPTFRSELP